MTTTPTQTDDFEAWIAEKRNSAGTYDYPMRDLIQVDGWADPDDPDGDDVFGRPVREPQQSRTTVRIHIDPDAEREDVLRVLRRQLAWLEEDDGPLSPDWLDLDAEPPF